MVQQYSHLAGNNTGTQLGNTVTACRFAGTAVSRDHTTLSTESWPRASRHRCQAPLCPSSNHVQNGDQVTLLCDVVSNNKSIITLSLSLQWRTRREKKQQETKKGRRRSYLLGQRVSNCGSYRSM